MIIETSIGLSLDIDKDVFNNMEVLDALADLNDGDPLAISRLSNIVLTKDQKKQVYDALRKDGRVDVMAYANFITELMTSAGKDTKN